MGFDGTTSSRAAVLWAASEAAEIGALLRVLVVWQPGTLDATAARWLPGPDGARQLARAGADMATRSRGHGVRVVPEVRVGVAARCSWNRDPLPASSCSVPGAMIVNHESRWAPSSNGAYERPPFPSSFSGPRFQRA